MGKLIVVSNRLPSMMAGARPGQPEIPAGGLASAVFVALRNSPRSIWFGWNGKVASRDRIDQATRNHLQGVELVGIPLSQAEQEDYYQGFCNLVLWPLFHCFQGSVHIELRQEVGYRKVQARFADLLMPHLHRGDRVWVHDYHLLLLGRELRRRGWTGKTGFFLHIPFPPHEMLQLLPNPRDFLEALLEYDLVGFQVSSFRDNYIHCCRRQLDARWDGSRLTAGGKTQRVGLYPVGIEPEDFRPPEGMPPRGPRRGALARVVRGRRLILGVDRLDYTKGLPERILAYEHFVRRFPGWRKKVSFIQIGSPSRTGAARYQEEKRTVEALVGRVNGELAEHDWVPIRYLYRNYPREDLARFYREADVGLITPLRDGMNLVAKEFVAAQYPQSPGVLVLSRCAGAAEDLPEAVIVNPYFSVDVAEGLARALSMPLEERLERHRALLARVLNYTASDWGRRFTRDLEDPVDDHLIPKGAPRPHPEARNRAGT